MLKITVSEEAATQKWVLQGWLMGPWVNELRMNWDSMREKRAGRACLVDVSDVICMDASAESLFEEMIGEGAQLVGCGVYTKHLLSSLGRKRAPKCAG